VPGRYVTVRISDTGVGMSPEAMRRAVEPFYSTKAVGKGSGLGLSTALGFAQQSGGDLTIRSAPGHGTTVTLYLPEARPGKTGDDEPRARACWPSTADERAIVLVVDDEQRTRRLASRTLSELGYRVLEADNAAAAVQVLEDTPAVDLLFTDIVMPGAMDGRDLGHWARRHRPEVKVLLTSGFPQPTPGENDAGGDALPFLKKPYSNEELREAVRPLLRSRISSPDIPR
jgi:CheY-like chemotaxis protein